MGSITFQGPVLLPDLSVEDISFVSQAMVIATEGGTGVTVENKKPCQFVVENSSLCLSFLL